MKKYFATLSKKRKILVVSLIVLLIVSSLIIIFIIGESRFRQDDRMQLSNIVSYPDVSYPVSYQEQPRSSSFLVSYPSSNSLAKQRSLEYIVTSSYYDVSTRTIEAKVEEGEKLTALLTIESQGLDAVTCIGETSKYINGEQKIIETKEIKLGSLSPYTTYVLGVGEYRIEYDCVFDGESHIEKFKAKVVAALPSICDTSEVVGDFETKNFEESKEGLVGVWNGCTKNQWGKPFRVQFTFNNDGTYSTQNLEIYESPGTLRTNSATNWGKDNEARVFGLQKLDESGLQGFIFFFVNSAPVGTIKNLKLDTTGTKLYFEIVNTTYEPMQYLLTKE